MNFTINLPSLKSIGDMFLVAVLWYSSLIHPSYDWYVFGAALYLGALINLRSWYRRPTPQHVKEGYWETEYTILQFVIHALWVLHLPILLSAKVVTGFNKKAA